MTTAGVWLAAGLAAGWLVAWLAAGQRWRKHMALLVARARQAAIPGSPPGPRPGAGGPEVELQLAVDALGAQLGELRASEEGTRERARRLAESVLEAIPDPVLVLDGDAGVTRFNSAARQLFGTTIHTGASAAELGSATLRLVAEEAAVGFPVASSQVPRVEVGGRRFRVRGLPLPAPGEGGAVLVLQDVSASEDDAERARQTAQGALLELRPLVDALGVALLAPDPPPGLGQPEWRAMDRVLRDLVAATVERAAVATDLNQLAAEVVEAVALGAQRRKIKLVYRPELPAPAPVTDPVALERLLLRLLGEGLRRRAPGDALRLEVGNRPGPLLRFRPALPAETASDPMIAALLERSQAALLSEAGPEPSTVLRFS